MHEEMYPTLLKSSTPPPPKEVGHPTDVASPLVGDEKSRCAAHKGRRYRLNRQPLYSYGCGPVKAE